MRFYWLIDRVNQGQFKVYWERGNKNLADYFTKHHPASHHRRVRPIYVTTDNSPSTLQGCIKLLADRAPKSSLNESQPATQRVTVASAPGILANTVQTVHTQFAPYIRVLNRICASTINHNISNETV